MGGIGNGSGDSVAVVLGRDRVILIVVMGESIW